MPSYSVRRQRIKEFKDVCSGTSDSIAQQVLEDNSWNVQQAINHFFNNRHLYPELKQGSKGKLEKIWKEYADKEDPSIMSEQGMLQFFKDCGVNPESHETLAIAWHLQSSEMGLFQKEEFVSGFSKSGCSDKKDIKKQIGQVCRSLSDEKQFKEFYKWIFHHVKEDEKKKTIPTELAIQLWQIVLSTKKHSMPLLEGWLKFSEKAQASNMQVVSRDVWEQIYDFLRETKSVDDYDDNGAWPVAVDEFVEFLQEDKK
eukprot:CAMPEP_0197024110 /NCGR_PEP_ID=MMETSP1384-20130603/4754_1 /TAXON_ID=29189 /ORGANISM="Ammonia sp." /LENGTH=255 /DNA_ID=CAMNT_0042452449 /DNA_START=191 /DNA_END=958 /DNA_ORIENTATION=+